MTKYEMWTHGVDVQIEYPDRSVGISGDRRAQPRRSGWGTLVYQMGGTTNWFHFGIPTPAIMANQQVFLDSIRLRAEINENAQIDVVHIRHGNRKISTHEVNLTDGSTDETFYQVPKQMLLQGIALCIHIRFIPGEKLGMVIFQGAGASFSVE
ncbi:hypothetical protein D3OALGB2SA_1300 [Olavius algarvensis associated proteobacterium Delta 3]|nr:hypothetical protein D3OALGB2SA_1300 [Olavius algarvensis associated proteobacterium Delta 3]